jgi:hypothetical protein
MTETDSTAMPEPDQAEPRAMQSRPSSPWNAERDTGRCQRIGLAKTGRALSKRRLQRAAPKAKAPAIVHRAGKGFARTGKGRALVKTKNPFFGFGQPGNRRAPHKVAVPGISDIPQEAPDARFAVSIWDAGAKHCRWVGGRSRDRLFGEEQIQHTTPAANSRWRRRRAAIRPRTAIVPTPQMSAMR